MELHDWHAKRKELTELVLKDRQTHWQQGHPHLNVAITEMAIRELFDKVEALEARIKSGAK